MHKELSILLLNRKFPLWLIEIPVTVSVCPIKEEFISIVFDFITNFFIWLSIPPIKISSPYKVNFTEVNG